MLTHEDVTSFFSAEREIVAEKSNQDWPAKGRLLQDHDLGSFHKPQCQEAGGEKTVAREHPSDDTSAGGPQYIEGEF